MQGDDSEPIFIDDEENANWLHRYGKESGLRERDERIHHSSIELPSCHGGGTRNDKLKDTLARAAAEWFGKRGLGTRRDLAYCLERTMPWQSNLILPELAHPDVIDESKIHRHFRSGLSSQAMLLNLVGPLLLEGCFAPIEAAMRAQGIEWPDGISRGKFEYEDRRVFNETPPGTPTSIDLALLDGNEIPRIFIEAKLAEEGFGGCSRASDCPIRDTNPLDDLDACYLHKQRGRTYWNVLTETGFLEGELARAPRCILADHYQFFREAAFAVRKGGTFILLCDDRNVALWGDDPSGGGGLFARLRGLLPEALRERAAAVSVQQIVAAIRETCRHDWIEEFVSKYGLRLLAGVD
ncbi:MAG: hypothetical protein ABSD48_15615 [Armatimonadota bacterium]|jgi:hypothetical protein